MGVIISFTQTKHSSSISFLSTKALSHTKNVQRENVQHHHKNTPTTLNSHQNEDKLHTILPTNTYMGVSQTPYSQHHDALSSLITVLAVDPLVAVVAVEAFLVSLSHLTPCHAMLVPINHGPVVTIQVLS